MLINKLTSELHRPVHLALYLNLCEDGKHGCSRACSFCAGRLHPTKLAPTAEDVKEYLETYSDYAFQNDGHKSVAVSGGGDPLYNFEKNKDYLLSIFKTIENCGFDIVMQSYELDIIDKYGDSLFANINTYYFSVEGFDPKVVKLADKLLAANKYVGVSKIINFSANPDEINGDNINTWINYYAAHCTSMSMHENYYCCFSRKENIILKEKFKQLNETVSCKINYNGHRGYNNKFIALINNEVGYSTDYIHTYVLPDTYKKIFIANYTPQKIAILGNIGSGKSTLASKLATKGNIPVYYLDNYLFNPNGHFVDQQLFIDKTAFILQEPFWIIEGKPYFGIDPNLTKADTIIFIALDPQECAQNAQKRFETGEIIGGPSELDYKSCPKRLQESTIRKAATFNNNSYLNKIMYETRYQEKLIYCLHSYEEINDFVNHCTDLSYIDKYLIRR